MDDFIITGTNGVQNMTRDIIVIERVDTDETYWYHAVIPGTLIPRITTRLPFACFPSGDRFTGTINIFGDYYTFYYFNARRDFDNLEAICNEDEEFKSIEPYMVVSCDLYRQSNGFMVSLGGNACVTSLCGCESKCDGHRYKHLYAAIDIAGLMYCLSFDLAPLRCIIQKDECAASYLCNCIYDYFAELPKVSEKRPGMYTDAVKSFLKNGICRKSNAQLLTRVTEKAFREIVQKEVHKQ